jgi:predicted nucleotide-binding protein
VTKKKIDGPLPPPNLTVSKKEALQKLNSLIEQGKSYHEKEIKSIDEFEQVSSSVSRWSSYCKEMLRRYFDNTLYADDFEYSGWSNVGIIGAWGGGPPLGKEIKTLKYELRDKLHELESIKERLELIKDPIGTGTKDIFVQKTLKKERIVFIVHGHDEAAKQSVARYLERLDLKLLILHEQPNRGRTIIEKFEDYSNVSFAIILLTPDDIGYRDGKPEEAKSRARQNVIFELGYFIGKIGRENVFALYKEGVELPSDFQGVVYEPMDTGEGWKIKLAKDIKLSGIDIDLNKAL